MKKYRFKISGTLTAALSLVSLCVSYGQSPFKILVFGAIAHDPAFSARDSINAMLRAQSKLHGFTLDTTSKGEVFTRENLAQYRLVVMNNTSGIGKSINPEQRSALMEYLQTHGHVGIHYAAQTVGTWDDYARYLGTDANSHVPAIGTLILDSSQTPSSMHPIVKGLATSARLADTWLWMRDLLPDPRGVTGTRILYSLDPSSCPTCPKSPYGEKVNPMVWTRTLESGGRMFYMAMGHYPDLFKPDTFCSNLLLRAITWAAGELEEPSSISPLKASHASRNPAGTPYFRSGYVFRFADSGIPTLEPSDLTGRRVPGPR